MKETDPYSRNKSTPGHPDENELAQYAEYLRSDAGNLPEKLVRHVESCSYCRAELMAITDLLDELPDLAEEPAEDSLQPAVGSRQGAVGSRQFAVGRRQSAVGSRQFAVGRGQDVFMV